ncbi:unnamed protein product [Dovyalis caffra]|uniref:Uncharacterized protein n=1 Tax=Dovyalis caffra TaxID=77055 RepID=A0AAV1SNH1_9ROSI|nr:unnamed protein product [Dovyalis caffra]
MEKNQLIGFFKLMQGQLAAMAAGTDFSGGHDNGNDEEEGEKGEILEEDLERLFVEFFSKMQLPPKLNHYDQEETGVSKDFLKTKDGNRSHSPLPIIHYFSFTPCAAAFFYTTDPEQNVALTYPVCGQVELSKAFSPLAALRDCLYVSSMPVTALLMDKLEAGAGSILYNSTTISLSIRSCIKASTFGASEMIKGKLPGG